MKYYSYSDYLKRIFNERVHRISVDAGFTCPNRDGTKGKTGCIYCYAGSNYNLRQRSMNIEKQISFGMEGIKRRYKAKKFLVYFQAFTNTYAPVDVLKRTYDTIRKFKDVVGIIIGTRPDCVPDEVLKLISSYTKDYLVWVEYGLESSHFKSLRWMNRGHGVSDFVDAVLRTRKFKDINICAHVILGLPTEDHTDMMETADMLAALRIDGVKLHALHILKDTPLGRMYMDKPFKLLTEEEYVETAVDFIERLNPNTVIQRITGEAPEDILIAPKWCGKRNKNRVIELIRKRMDERQTYQGKFCRFNV